MAQEILLSEPEKHRSPDAKRVLFTFRNQQKRFTTLVRQEYLQK